MADSASTKKMKEVLEAIANDFEAELHSIIPKPRNRPSIMKNRLSDLSKFLVCKPDQAFILRILEKCIDLVSLPDSMRIMRYLLQLGQKDPEPLSIVELFHFKDHIMSISIHTACSVSSKDRSMDLMWSRYGLNKHCGRRGSVFISMSFREAANFQSNLDHRPMEVDRKIWQVFRKREQDPIPLLNFVQLYCNAPHRHQTPCYKHPVSGVIVTLGALHKDTNKAMLHRAIAYVEHFKDLAEKTQINLQIRLEGVLYWKGNTVPDTLAAKTMFNEEHLFKLLRKEAMLVPFANTTDQSLHEVVTEVVNHLVGTVSNFFTEAKLSSGYNNC